MALIVCPECGGKVSDKASACPHCGYPILNANSEKNALPHNLTTVLQLLPVPNVLQRK